MIEFILVLTIAAIVTYPFLGKSFYKMENTRGIALSLCLGALAFGLGKIVPVVGGSVFGIFIGLVFSLFAHPKSCAAGVKITGKKGLQGAIVLFGFEMSLAYVLEVGANSVFLIIISISASLLTAYFMFKILKPAANIATLVGIGTAICGGSAIAAAAPAIEAEDEQVAVSMSTIFLFNVLAVFIFPALGRVMGLDNYAFGLWAGSAINDTSSVVAASYSYSDAAGQLATVVKLTRSLMIIPITFILAVYTAKKKQKSTSFSVKSIFPWFILGFVGTCIINTFEIIPTEISGNLGDLGKYFMTVAMAAIGMSTDIKKLISNSKAPILLGLCCWIVVAATSFLVISFM